MAFGGQHRGIRLPKIGVTDRTLPIEGWERLPQLPRGGTIPLAQGHTHNFATVAIEGQPDRIPLHAMAWRLPFTEYGERLARAANVVLPSEHDLVERVGRINVWCHEVGAHQSISASINSLQQSTACAL